VSVLDPLRLDEKRAELVWLNARAKVLAAELDAAGTPSLRNASQLVYSPTWKIGGRPHLSPEGEKAILAAYDQGMRPAEVARLFRISERAAANWQRRWQNPKKAA
jgi:hypothetical protein